MTKEKGGGGQEKRWEKWLVAGWAAWRGKNFLFPSIVCETKVFSKKIEKKIFISIFLSTLGKINILIEAMTLVSQGRSLFEDGIASRNDNWSDPVKECGVFPQQALSYFL